MDQKNKELDVLIIGAGVSGLTCAYELLQKDKNISLTVLEANDRVGGRTLTEEVSLPDGTKEKFDLGGQWVGQTQHHVMDLLKKFDIETYPQNTKGRKVMVVGKDAKIRTYTNDIPSLGSYFGLIELDFFIRKAESLAKKISMEDPYASALAKELDNVTLDSYVRSNLRTQGARDVIQAAVRASMGTEMCRLSALFFIAYANAAGGVMRLFLANEGDAQELRVKGGTQQLSKIMTSKIGEKNVLLKEPVVSIAQDETGITVTTLTGKSFRAKYLVSTMPPNCLNRVQFSPPLAEGRRTLMHNMPSGHLTKFVVTYDKSYWTEEGYSGEIVSNGGPSNIDGISNGPLSVVYDATTNNGVPALVGFIAGRQGVEWAGVEADVRRKAVLEDLAKCLGSWAKKPTSFTEKNWSDELYAGGCPVGFNVPGVAYSFQYLRKPEGRIFWAGTETATIWTGYISGAIQSGKRAAMEILHNLSAYLVTEEELQGTYYDVMSRKKADTVEPNTVFRWTIALPIATILFAWVGISLRNKYGVVLSGKII